MNESIGHHRTAYTCSPFDFCDKWVEIKSCQVSRLSNERAVNEQTSRRRKMRCGDEPTIRSWREQNGITIRRINTRHLEWTFSIWQRGQRVHSGWPLSCCVWNKFYPKHRKYIYIWCAVIVWLVIGCAGEKERSESYPHNVNRSKRVDLYISLFVFSVYMCIYAFNDWYAMTQIRCAMPILNTGCDRPHWSNDARDACVYIELNSEHIAMMRWR